MTATNLNIQLSGKATDGRIFVVGGNDVDDFLINLSSVLGSKEAADEALADAASLLQPVSANGVPAVVRQAFPQAAPVQQQAAPVAAVTPSTPPSGAPPACHHGQKVYRNGEKNGKQWQAYFCPSPKGTADQCPPQFIRNNG